MRGPGTSWAPGLRDGDRPRGQRDVLGGAAPRGPAVARAAAEGEGAAAEGEGAAARSPPGQGRRRRAAGNSAQKFGAGEGGRPHPGYLKTQSSRASLAGEISPCFLLKSFWNRVGGILGRRRWPPPPRRWAPRSAVPSARLVPPARLHGCHSHMTDISHRRCQRGGRRGGTGRPLRRPLIGCGGGPTWGAGRGSAASPPGEAAVGERVRVRARGRSPRGPAAAQGQQSPGVAPRGWAARGGDGTPLFCFFRGKLKTQAAERRKEVKIWASKRCGTQRFRDRGLLLPLNLENPALAPFFPPVYLPGYTK